MRYASPFQKGCFIAMPSVSLMQFDLISIANANLTQDALCKNVSGPYSLLGDKKYFF